MLGGGEKMKDGSIQRPKRVWAWVARHFRSKASETCILLVAEAEKMGIGQLNYVIRDSIIQWMNRSDNWIDAHVLGMILRDDALARIRGDIIVNITNGWKDRYALEAVDVGQAYPSIATLQNHQAGSSVLDAPNYAKAQAGSKHV